jgi:hypothetical protein
MPSSKNIKIVRNGEGFWVRVRNFNKTNGFYHGTVLNNLFMNKYKYGDRIRFKKSEVNMPYQNLFQ